MIVDTSALVAIAFQEPGHERLAAALADAGSRRISAATLVEFHAVVDRHTSPLTRRRADAVVEAFRIEVEPFTAEQAAVAREAYRDLGRGSGHPARLDLGDTFAYALATVTGEPLLFAGNDFAATDVRPAPA